MEKHNQEQTTVQKAGELKTEELNIRPRIKGINSFLFIALLCCFLFGCAKQGYYNQKIDCNKKRSKILSIEYYSNTKVVKRLVVENHVECNNCQSKIYFVSKSNTLDSVVVNYDVIIEEFEYYQNGNKKYFGIFYERFGNKYAIFWKENGLIESTGEYVFCDKSTFNLSDYPWTSSPIRLMKNGIWVYYKENGEIEKTETYENGVLKRE